MPVAECHRLELEECFTGFIHRLDCFLEAGRGNDGTELPSRINHHSHLGATSHRFAVNAGNISGSLRALLAEADLARLACIPEDIGSDHDVIAAGSEIETGINPYGDVQ